MTFINIRKGLDVYFNQPKYDILMRIFISYFQFSLLLEYCSRGTLRSYLIDHQFEFGKALEHYDMYGRLDYPNPSESKKRSGIPHNIKMLYRWSYQAS